ncbi:DUF1983 domain-containing protein [Pantoea sp. Acro-835]|uniref:DUF1983 domain-containing protein n=2 Tax=Candidatus Pantoea multigeneris TaxID=2608357 RepID=A0ABX0R591_9GAMM|nr:DUF1983 domain-containing protein [Pantoea multigeneris]
MRLLDGATIIRGSKGGSQSAQTPTEQPDDLLSTAKLKLLIALGEGEIQGDLTAQNIFLGDTPLANDDGTYNFTGVKWEYRTGTQDQEYIQGMPEVDNELAVGLEVKQASPWTHQYTNLSLDAVRIKLSLPAQYQYKDNGDMVGTSTQYVIELSTDGAAWQIVVEGVFSGKTTSEYQRDHRIDLPKATSGWSIRVRRITADSTSATKLVNAFKVFSYAEVIDSKLRYPNTALLFLELDASQFNGSVPKTTCKYKGKLVRVPDNYDPNTRTYTGTWTGSFKWAYTNNPAWIFYDLVLDKIYGMGNRVDASMIDKWELYTIAQYCDDMVSDGAGGKEPRFTCNAYIQSQEDAYTVLKDIAAIFRGITFWGNDQIYVRADAPQDDVDFVYHASNVIDGLFTYAGGSYKNRYTSCQVSWSDPQNNYSDTPEAVYDKDLVERYGVNETQLTAIGCTSQSEAHRRGRWLLLSNAKDGTISFGVGLDGYIPLPAEIIGVADPYRAGKQNGGRISAVNGLNVTLDRAINYASGDRLVLNLPDGTAQTRTIGAVSADKKTVTVTTAFRQQPVAGGVWAIDSDNLAIQYFRITSIASNDDGTFTVTGVQHDKNKYQYIDDGVKVDAAPITITPAAVMQAPKNITVTEVDHIDQGLTVATMQVQWDKVEGAISYTAQWRKDKGDWINVGQTSTQGFSIQGIYAGVYDVRVRSVNAADISSPWGTSESVSLPGKVGKPGTPLNLLASDNVVWNIKLSWAFPAGSGDTSTTEIQQATTADGQNPQLLVSVAYPSTSYQHGPMAAGVRRWYRARLVDRIGNAGDWTGWVQGVTSTDTGALLNDITEAVMNSETGKALVERITSVESDVSGLDSAVDQAQADIKSARDDLSTAKTDIQQNKTDIKAARDDLSSAKIDIQQNKTDIKAARDDLDLAREQVNTSLTGINNNISDVNTRVTNVNNDIQQKINTITGGSSQSIATVVSQVETLQANDQSMSTRLDAVVAKSDGNATAIATEQTARANADSALGTRIDTITTQTGNNSAAITALQNAQTTTDNSLAEFSRVTSAKFDAGAAADIENALSTDKNAQQQRETSGKLSARITQSEQAQADDREAFAVYRQSVEARFDSTGSDIADVSAQVLSEQGARASADDALSSRVDAVTATAAGNAASIVSEAKARADADQGLTEMVMAVSAKTDSNAASINTEITARTDADSALAKRIDTVTASTGANATAITTEQTARANADTALGQRITDVKTTTDSNTARLTTVEKAVTDNQSATVKRLDSLDASVGNNASAIATEQTARADGDTALGKRIDTVSASTSSNTSAITTEQTARANADTALGKRIDTVEASAGSNATAITTEQTARANADTALGQRITDVKATTDNNTSRLTTVEKAVTDNQSATTTRLNSLDASVASNATAITTEQTARANADTALGTRIDSVKTSTDGNTASIGLLQTAQTTTDQALATLTQSTEAYFDASAMADIENALANDKDAQNQRAAAGVIRARVTQAEKAQADANQAFASYQREITVQFDNNSARVSTLEQAQSDSSQAFAQFQQTTTAQLNTFTASIQQNASAISAVDGKVSAQYNVKVQVDQNGVLYAAGMGIGMENGPNGMQSTVAFLADRFVIMSQVGTTPKAFFALQNGQAIMDTAFIGDATIGRGKITDTLQSDNFVSGMTGLSINFKTGVFENNGYVAGQGRMTWSNNRLVGYDASGNVVFILGQQ